MILEIPGREKLKITDFVFDMNGTLAVDGYLDVKVGDYLRRLSDLGTIHLVTADTFETAGEIQERFPSARLHVISPDQPGDLQKAQYVKKVGADHTAVFGNGRNDRLMFMNAAPSVAVIGEEGLYPELLRLADVVVHDICSAMQLFLSPRRLVATLRD